jgi:hypothetical protein
LVLLLFTQSEDGHGPDDLAGKFWQELTRIVGPTSSSWNNRCHLAKISGASDSNTNSIDKENTTNGSNTKENTSNKTVATIKTTSMTKTNTTDVNKKTKETKYNHQ